MVIRWWRRNRDDSDDPGAGLSFEARRELWLALFASYGHHPDLEILDHGISVVRHCLVMLDKGDSRRAEVLNDLATALQLRFENTNNDADADAAIEAMREGIAAMPDHPETGTALGILTGMLKARYSRGSNRRYLDEAVTVAREAYDRRGDPGNPEYMMFVDNLASTLHLRYQVTTDQADLDEMIAILTEARRAIERSHPRWDTTTANLATALQIRYDRIGSAADIDQAIRLAQESAAGNGVADAGSASATGATALFRRSRRRGAALDLDNAIATGRHRVLTSTDALTRAGDLSELAGMLWDRSGNGEDPADAREAIETLWQAILTPDLTRTLSVKSGPILLRS